MNTPRKYCFFTNDCEGGVANVIGNIIKYSYTDGLYFKVIAIHCIESSWPRIKENSFDVELKKIEYSNIENIYYVQKKISQLISDNETVIIANDNIELQMCAVFKLPNPIVFILHGNYEYYFKIATTYEPIIDRFITVSNIMQERLIALIPHRKQDISYLPFPVSNVNSNADLIENKNLKIIFVGRLTREKGAFDLPLIDSLLKENKCLVKWTLIGNGTNDLLTTWKINNENVRILGSLPHLEVLELYPQHDIIILPSRAEGFPMVIAEAMKAGLVPLLTNLDNITEFIKEAKNGFTVPIGEIATYVERIRYLDNNRDILKLMKKNSKITANEKFDPDKAAGNYMHIFNEASLHPIKKTKIINIRMNKLDNKWIPNNFVMVLRKFKRKYRKSI